MPGDIVHIIVEAPFDTQQVSAVMPDEQKIDLTYDGRRTVWHGYWEVPYGFKKGVYTAVLLAVDVEGKTFQGQSSQFIIGEPTMALLVQLASKAGPPLPRLPASNAVPSFVPERITKPLPLPSAVSAPAITQHKKENPPAKKSNKKMMVKKSRKYWTAGYKKPAIRPAAKKQLNGDLRAAKLTEATREFIARQNYSDARNQLAKLSKTQPKNYQMQLMLARLDAIIKARGK